MVAIVTRMNRMREMLNIRVGPGAAILPPELTRVHLEFGQRGNNGHFGPRKFWRKHMTRLKFWNPAIPMIVNRTADNESRAILSLYFRQPSTPTTAGSPPPTHPPISRDIQPGSALDGSSTAPAPLDNERVVTIDMTNQHSDAILSEFMSKTGAVPMVPTDAEEKQLQEVEEYKKKAVVDREVHRRYMEQVNREKRLLAKASEEAASMKVAE